MARVKQMAAAAALMLAGAGTAMASDADVTGATLDDGLRVVRII